MWRGLITKNSQGYPHLLIYGKTKDKYDLGEVESSGRINLDLRLMPARTPH